MVYRLLVAVIVLVLTAVALPFRAEAAPRGQRCVSNAECDDRLFCNGVERCENSSCRRPASGPCGTGQCNEFYDVCQPPSDADGDGVDGVYAAGGTDCDDADASRFPGATEICNPPNDPDEIDTHDEDCDPLTVGTVDLDRDGHSSSRCCNADGAGILHCGDDCDDTRISVHRGSPEVCDHLDNNCSGEPDEGVAVLVFPDSDGDAHGSGSGSLGCLGDPEMVRVGNDCDENHAAIQPGAFECDPAQGASAVRICSPHGAEPGSFVPAACLDGRTCVAQANGTGRCLVRGAASEPATCKDGILSGDETSVDCGGPTCSSRCELGSACVADSDCAIGACTAGFCQLPPPGEASPPPF